MKCELWQTANSDELLPYYSDDPVPKLRNLADFTGSPAGEIHPQERKFNMTNIFKEIDYVGEAQFTLDITNTGAFNPMIGISEYNHIAK